MSPSNVCFAVPSIWALMTTYFWSESEGLCREQPTSGDYVLYKPLPAEVLDAFPNPPYRVTVAY